jgi:Leucine-rich repeat (LRR) protein
LEEFPVGVSNLVALEELHFGACRTLKAIPESFGNLTKLKMLRMYECEALEEFPVGVSNLVALEELHFGACRTLKAIPECFGNLTKLKILRMYECEALRSSL